MDRSFSLTFGKREYSFTVPCLLALLYLGRPAALVFAEFFHISTGLVGGGILAAFFFLLIIYTMSTKNISYDGIILVLCVIAFFVITLYFHPEYQDRFDDVYFDGRWSAKQLFTYGAGIYAYYLVRLFRDDEERIYRTFKILSYVLFIGYVWQFLDRSSELGYDMTFGYAMELAAILFLMQYFMEKGKIWKLILSLICMVMTLLYGSRAAILGYVVFVVLYLVWQRRVAGKQLFLLIIGVIAAVIYNIQSIMLSIYNFCAAIGFDSRTLYNIASGNIMTDDTSRQNIIWPKLIDALFNDGLFKIRGAYGDRLLISTDYGYAHNMVLEILLTFGIIIGSIILLWILIRFVRTCLNKNSKGGLVTIAIGSYVLCKLMLSDTFWEEPFFWALLALLVTFGSRKYIRKKNLEEKSS